MSPASFGCPAPASVAATFRAIAVDMGAAIARARDGRGWSRIRLAETAGVSRSLVYLVERGEPASIEAYARIGHALGLRLEVRLVDRRRRVDVASQDPIHAAMGELEARLLRMPGRNVALDEPYQHFQFAGRADVVAWDAKQRAMLHIENKTRIPNVQELAGSFGAKRAYLGPVLAERLGVGAWRTECHVIAALWSAEVLHVLRLRQATFAALCPDPATTFRDWLSGDGPSPGRSSLLVLFDPAATGRQRRFVGLADVGSVRPRYSGYRDAVLALRRCGLL